MRTYFIGLAAALGFLNATSLLAHAKLLSASPADGAELAAAPGALTLSFAQPVKVGSVTVSGAGRAIPITIDRGAKAMATVVLPLPSLAAGRYTVRWSAIWPGDGHVSKGSLTFTVHSTKH